MGRNVKKRTFRHVRPTNTQISLRIRAVWSESSWSAWRNVTALSIQNAPSGDSDQTARRRRLIWIFAGRTCPKVRFLTLRAHIEKWVLELTTAWGRDIGTNLKPLLHSCQTYLTISSIVTVKQKSKRLPLEKKNALQIENGNLGFTDSHQKQ